MTGHRRHAIALLAALACWPALARGQDTPPPFDRAAPPGDPPPVPGFEKGMRGKEPEVLGRGPLHEGYAQPHTTTPRPAPAVPKAPPAPIREAPPDERPDGDNVVWIPGYWMWDDDRRDHIWVSGFWRVVPPNRKWVPGYWAKVEGGHRRVSGFWADATRPTVPYVDEPPATLEAGPNVPSPDDGYQWVPGIWLPRDDSWMWRPGFWMAPSDGWVYTPACYNWTPRGYLYSGGFWDRCLMTRGVPFAPVYFGGGFFNSPGYCYTPNHPLQVGNCLGSFWARPNWGYYAFGDFYGAGYSRLGYQPWYRYGPGSRDPLFGYYNNAFGRRNPGWAAGLASTFHGRAKGTLPAPPRTFAASGRLTELNTRTVTPLASYRNPDLPLVRGAGLDRSAGERHVAAYQRAGAERAREELRPVPGGARPGALSLSSIPTPPAPRPRAETAPSMLDTRPRELTRPGTIDTRPRITAPARAMTPTIPGAAARAMPAPRTMTAPRTITAPRTMPLPRAGAAPRMSAPAPRFAPVAPRGGPAMGRPGRR